MQHQLSKTQVKMIMLMINYKQKERIRYAKLEITNGCCIEGSMDVMDNTFLLNRLSVPI